MILSTKFIKLQMKLFKPFILGMSIDAERKAQETIGNLMARAHKDNTEYAACPFDNFTGEMITPRTQNKDAVMLYLHGGGFIGGDLDYARGFGTILASEFQVKVFSIAYRLAPENRFPAALEDTLEAYLYLLNIGYTPGQIVLCGESAGGGLVFSLCLKLKELKLELPCGLIGISPWTDLTSSGISYEENSAADPSMSKERLQFYAECYSEDLHNPLVSPLFGDLSGFPPSLIIVGGDEVMLSDATNLHRKLLEYNCDSELTITPGMWHAYVLYQVKESKKDYEKIRDFLKQILR